MTTDDVKKLVRSLRESAQTFEHNIVYALPAMAGFIRRHIQEIRTAADELELRSIKPTQTYTQEDGRRALEKNLALGKSRRADD